MKQIFQKLFNIPFLAIFLAGTCLIIGQEKQSRTYKETFRVQPDAVVDIDVSYADIAFETWDKNEVSVEATIELEGASPEEARKFFEKGGIEILGNSTLVEIRTTSSSPVPPMAPHAPFIADVPQAPNIEPLFFDLQIPDLPPLPEIPPMPPVPMPEFDYEAYQKDGEKYLKKWKEHFDKNFDKDYRKKMEDWSKEMAAGAEERRRHMEKWQKEHQELLEERKEHHEEIEQRQQEMRELAREQAELAREHAKVAREHAREVQRHVIINRDGDHDAPHIFYRLAEGEGKNLKIKKTIRIKMPKSVKLKMNVRHGEVKLAENTRDLEATLFYARLLASTIDGQKTQISASFTPVNVQNWNYGSLKTDFSDNVALKLVKNLDLKANSSNVTIDRLISSGQLTNNLGQLSINSVSDSFNSVNIVLQNGELMLNTPESAFSLLIEGTASNFNPPSYLSLKKSGDQKQLVYKGYHINENSNRAIHINSRYSTVTLQQ